MKPIPQKLFDILRFLQIFLAGVAALYASLAQIWQWPYAPQISATAAAISTFIGIFLKIDTTVYFKEGSDDSEH